MVQGMACRYVPNLVLQRPPLDAMAPSFLFSLIIFKNLDLEDKPIEWCGICQTATDTSHQNKQQCNA